MQMFIEKISSKLISNGIILEEDQEIYCFGIECIILKIIHYLSYFAISFLLEMPLQLMIMGFAFMPLRKNVGGYHAKTKLGCYIISCLIVFFSLMFYRYDTSNFLYAGCWIVSMLVIYLMAPCDTANKRMSESEIQYFKRNSRIIILVIGTLVLLGEILHLRGISKLLIIGSTVSAISLIAGKVQRRF